MDIFGIGIPEVLAVFFIMAIVFGPRRLPEIAARAGRAVRELREYARDFRDEYLTDFEEAKEDYLEIRHEINTTRENLDEDAEQVVGEARDAAHDAEQAVATAEAAARGDADDSDGEPAAPVADASPVRVVPSPPAPQAAPQPAERPDAPDDAPSDSTRPGNIIAIDRSRRGSRS